MRDDGDVGARVVVPSRFEGLAGRGEGRGGEGTDQMEVMTCEASSATEASVAVGKAAVESAVRAPEAMAQNLSATRGEESQVVASKEEGGTNRRFASGATRGSTFLGPSNSLGRSSSCSRTSLELRRSRWVERREGSSCVRRRVSQVARIEEGGTDA